MRCKEASYLTQLYLDHQLTLKQTRALEAHIASCTLCYEELALLEEVACGLNTYRLVTEPANMHEQIMQKLVAHQQGEKQIIGANYSLFRPSLPEILAAILLATVATLSILLQQPSVQAMLHVTDGHDPLALFYNQAVHMLTHIDTNTLILGLWIIGTLLGICITLAAAGDEVRSRWFKAVMERRPVR